MVVARGTGMRTGAMKLLVTIGLFALAGAAAAEKLPLPSGRPIVIRADAVAADPGRDVTSFRGRFEVEGTDWPLQADTAVIYGPLEKPERVVVTGKPARVWIKRKGVERAIAAIAEEIEYQREPEVLYLRGRARVQRGDRVTLEGDHFTYDIAGGEVVRSGRVRVWSVAPKELLP
jgi:lipopolysaccharide transport protein LptA